MRTCFAGLLAGALLIAAPLTARLAAPSPCGDDYPLAGGRFYSQTRGDSASGGFTVLDDAEARFWSAFERGGGVQVLGYPVSNRFSFKGMLTQAFQKAVLQWDPGKNDVNFLNTIDELHEAGKDGLLFAIRQTPPYVALSEDNGLNPENPEQFARIAANHLRLLDALDPKFKAWFQGDGWLNLYGLPISYYDFGNVKVLRAQRQVFQLWTAATEGVVVGEVRPANTGDFFKEFGLIPPEAAQPSEQPQRTAGGTQVSLSSPRVFQGQVLEVRIAGGPDSATVSRGPLAVPAACDGGSVVALFPISSIEETGATSLRVTSEGSGGQQTLDVPFEILPTGYPSENIVLSAENEQLLAPETVAEERALLVSIFGAFTTERRWTGLFRAPASGPVTSPFGERRTYGQTGLFDYHAGQDFAESIGAPVTASQRGVVAFAGPLKVRGNVVIIDHGRGVYSAYFHLSAIDVVTGASVETGQRVGAVGSTGLSTGPHMHWEVRILNVPVDPMQWTRTSFLAG